jgi:diaminopimelate decarboxylase
MTPAGNPVPTLAIEPGRSIVGEAGMTVYRIGATKTVPGGRRYIAVDGGMGDNIRPALYQASYQAAIDGKSNESVSSREVTVAGRYCESGDILLPHVTLPDPEVGDLLVTYVTGAYNYAMASNYNRVPRPPVVLVAGGKSRLWVERESWHDLTRYDRLDEATAD